MANNQYVNKVEFGGNTIIDITPTTAVESDVASGKIFFKADGSQATGSIDTKTSSDLTVSGDTVTAPSGYYSSNASASVASGSVSIPYTLINEPPTIVVSSAGLITSRVSASRTVSPNVTAGYITSGTSGNVSVTGSSTKQLSTQAGTTITPTESVQTAVGANKFTTGDVKVGAISSTYVGSGITRRDSTDLTASGDTVSVPSGYYENSASKAIAAGSATTPYTEIEANPIISVDSSGLIESRIQYRGSITPTVVAGYVSSGTSGDYNIDGINSYQLPTQAARTITPSQNIQIAVADGKYTTGIVSVNPIPPEYIIPSGVINITSNGSVNVKQYAIADVNIPPTIIATDTTPYNYKINSTDSDSNVLKKVIGATVAWNQLVQNGNFASATGWSARLGTVAVSGGVATVTPSSNGTDRGLISTSSATIPIKANHKYLLSVDVMSPINGTLALSISGSAQKSHSVTANTWVSCQAIWTSASDMPEGRFYALLSQNITTLQTIQYKKANAFDLTQMFGSTIADYIYALEQNTPGAGVAYFRNLFPAPYYEYNAGELMSVKTSAHKMVGFNAYNPTTGTAKLVGGNQYQITGAYTALSLDGTTITPDANGKFTPSANGTLTVTGGNNTTTCVHLVWDGERDGEYEPYEAHEYALSDITLRGFLKLDASNNLYADGDRYLPDGTVIRKRRQIVADGDTVKATSVSQSNGTYYCVFTALSSANKSVNSTTTETRIITDKGYRDYPGVGVGHIYITNNGILPIICLFDQTLTTVSAVNTYLASNPITIEYELATPTTETASQYTNIGRILQGYTETFVDNRTVPIPVGHSTDYLNINEVINVLSSI